MRLTEFCDRFGIQFNRKETVEIYDRNIHQKEFTPIEWLEYLKRFFPDNVSLNEKEENIVLYKE